MRQHFIKWDVPYEFQLLLQILMFLSHEARNRSQRICRNVVLGLLITTGEYFLLVKRFQRTILKHTFIASIDFNDLRILTNTILEVEH